MIFSFLNIQNVQRLNAIWWYPKLLCSISTPPSHIIHTLRLYISLPPYRVWRSLTGSTRNWIICSFVRSATIVAVECFTCFQITSASNHRLVVIGYHAEVSGWRMHCMLASSFFPRHFTDVDNYTKVRVSHHSPNIFRTMVDSISWCDSLVLFSRLLQSYVRQRSDTRFDNFWRNCVVALESRDGLAIWSQARRPTWTSYFVTSPKCNKVTAHITAVP